MTTHNKIHEKHIWIHVLILLLIVTAYSLLVDYHKTITWHWIIFPLLPIGLSMIASSLSHAHIRSSRVIKSLSYVSIIVPIMGLAAIVIPLSPFPIIDPYLKAFDSLLGINVAKIMQYFQVHFSVLMQFTWWIYDSIIWQVIATVLILPILSFESAKKFYLLALITFSMMTVFCFFFPSINPSESYHGYHFVQAQLSEVHGFMQFRADRLHSITADVSCPSFHVVVALILIKVWWQIRAFGVRYFFLALNILMTLSVLITGWHYFSDLLMAVLVYSLANFYMEKVL